MTNSCCDPLGTAGAAARPAARAVTLGDDLGHGSPAVAAVGPGVSGSLDLVMAQTSGGRLAKGAVRDGVAGANDHRTSGGVGRKTRPFVYDRSAPVGPRRGRDARSSGRRR